MGDAAELVFAIAIGAFYCVSFLTVWAGVELGYLVLERWRRK